MIEITNYESNCVLDYRLVVLNGQLNVIDENIVDENIICKQQNKLFKSLINSDKKFKFNVLLELGENLFVFELEKNKFIKLNFCINYKPKDNNKQVKLVYVTCYDSINTNKLFENGNYQSGKINSSCTIENAKTKISLASLMLQTFLCSILSYKYTFSLNLDKDNFPKVDLFKSKYTIDEYNQMTENEIWSNLAVELIDSNYITSDCKCLAFVSFSRYIFDKNKIENVNNISYEELIKMTNCYIALGGGSLAVFNTCSLFTWPNKIEEIIDKFEDLNLIDNKIELDDSGNNESTYGGVLSTSLGSVLHELLHTFDLGHETYGIMGREFEKINYFFINKINNTKIRWFNRSSYLILSKNKFLSDKCLSDFEDLVTIKFNHLTNLVYDKKYFKFKKEKSILESVNGIFLIEIRDKNSYTIEYEEFENLRKNISLSVQQNLFSKIIIMDILGNIVKTV